MARLGEQYGHNGREDEVVARVWSPAGKRWWWGEEGICEEENGIDGNCRREDGRSKGCAELGKGNGRSEQEHFSVLTGLIGCGAELLPLSSSSSSFSARFVAAGTALVGNSVGVESSGNGSIGGDLEIGRPLDRVMSCRLSCTNSGSGTFLLCSSSPSDLQHRDRFFISRVTPLFSRPILSGSQIGTLVDWFGMHHPLDGIAV
ncbi:unnamed protein product [Calypogeia fissa]